MPARLRIPSYAVWDTVIFALNILAFIFIGLQIRPILDSLEPAERAPYFAVAGAVPRAAQRRSRQQNSSARGARHLGRRDEAALDQRRVFERAPRGLGLA